MCRLTLIMILFALMSCGAKSGQNFNATMQEWADSESVAPPDVVAENPFGDFDADSAYMYVARQVAFGPRVPNTSAHREAGDWLAEELQRHGFQVIQQKAKLKAFDGTVLNARNIFGQLNPESKDRILLLSHWDSRPWADQDPDPQKRSFPVDGANDGASGVGVLLEIARQLSINPVKKGVDILFVDAEDWGTEGDDSSWALGTQYFVKNLPVKNYSPSGAILLDMVGGQGAIFCREYFSERSAPRLAEEIWTLAAQKGYGEMFANKIGTAVMDDHVELIKAGIPAIDIIEYHPDGEGFNPRWHTTSDNMEGISKETLGAIGSVLLSFIRKNQ